MIALVVFIWALVAVVAAHGLRFAAFALQWLPARPPPAARRDASVTLIRPVCGPDEDAVAKHLSLVHQDWPRLDVIFVAASKADPAVPAALAAVRASAGRARFVSAEDVPPFPSAKGRNMIAGVANSSAEFVAFCDSDLRLLPDDLERCLALFDAPDVGAVFAPCLFDAPGLPGRLAMLVASVDIAALMGGAATQRSSAVMQGGLMVLRRSALERAGGIGVVADALGDDLRLCRVLRSAGYRVRASRRMIVQRGPAESAATWAARYHRWMLCHRLESPRGFWPMFLCNPLVVPALAVALADASQAPLALLASSVVAEIVFAAAVDRALLAPLGIRLGPWLFLRPVADLLHFGLCAWAVIHPELAWRGQRYRVRRGRLERVARADVDARLLSPRRRLLAPSGFSSGVESGLAPGGFNAAAVPPRSA